ncbi:MAG: DUF2384 domain-containing protein [Oleiphilaceae bacterium]|nr:DUF2384 domain-containing protein [Oleiphilaceae bacterium]
MSERDKRIKELKNMALKLFNDDHDAAETWLSRPLSALGGKTPISMTKTNRDFTAVADLIGRLQTGVFN